jgi:hypothetical protein
MISMFSGSNDVCHKKLAKQLKVTLGFAKKVKDRVKAGILCSSTRNRQQDAIIKIAHFFVDTYCHDGLFS